MQLFLILLLTTTSTCLSQRLNAFEDFFERLLGPTVFADPFGDASWAPAQDISQTDDVRTLGPLGSRLAEMMRPLAMFDPFAMMSQMMESGGGFEMPNVTLSGSDCLVTVDIEGINPNNTSIKIYTTPSRIELEISRVQALMLADDDTEPVEDEDKEQVGHLRKREGHAGVSSFTTVRSFPAPEACDMTAHSSKATVDKEHNLLLIKFPKRTAAEAAEPSTSLASPQDSTDVVDAPEREAKESGKGWLTRLFKSNGSEHEKLAVPIVMNDEF